MKRIVMLILISAVAAACGQRGGRSQDQNQTQTPTRGQTTLIVDETLRPMAEAEVRVFESQYKYAGVKIVALPEHRITEILGTDSTARLAMLTRDLTDAELKRFEAEKLIPRVTEIAYDAIALVVNRDHIGDQVTEDSLRRMLRGEAAGRRPVMVFDNPASSTVRYMQSFAGMDSLPVYSVGSGKQLLEYIVSNPDAIGFIGVDWLYEADASDRRYIDRIKVLAVGSPEGGFYKPTQNDIAEGKYPFIRKVTLVNGQGTAGLGLGLASFIAGDVGQRIILKAGLVPMTYPKREIVVRERL